MKKFVKSVLALTLVLAITFAFAGCKIVMPEGKWVCSKMKATFSHNDTTVDLVQLGGEMQLDINEDGTFEFAGFVPAALPYTTYTEVVADSGSWSVDKTTVVLDGTKNYEIGWAIGKLTYTTQQQISPDGATVTIVCEMVLSAE